MRFNLYNATFIIELTNKALNILLIMFKTRVLEPRPVPYWHKLLLHFEKRGYIRNGLTIPFLLGAKKINDPETAMLSVEKLVMEFMEYGATIMKCGYINEFVIGSLDLETEQMAGYERKFKNFVISYNSFAMHDSIEKIVELLKGIYRFPLSENKFSKENGIWIEYTDTDLKCLKELN
jgi:hypothetical protein